MGSAGAHKKEGRSGEAGFTLVELLVVSVVMVFLFAGARGLLTGGLRTWTRLGQVQDLQAEAARLAASMSRDVRQATSISTPSPGSGSAIEPDTLASGSITLTYDGDPANDKDEVLRKTWERENDPDHPGQLREKLIGGNKVPMWWIEDRTVVYSRVSGTTTLRRTETLTWKKVEVTQEAGITPAIQMWTTTKDVTKNLNKISFYPYGSSSPYRLYRLLITLKHSGPQLASGTTHGTTEYQIKTMIHHRIP